MRLFWNDKSEGPNIKHLPNIHTSLADVNLLKLIDSGAIHLIGSLPLEALD